jgi:uncharacterized protein (TIGR02597 family)
VDNGVTWTNISGNAPRTLWSGAVSPLTGDVLAFSSLGERVHRSPDIEGYPALEHRDAYSNQLEAYFSAFNVQPAVVTATLPHAISGTTYHRPLVATGNSDPFVWELASGSLPAGLSLSAAGFISGTATTAGTSTFSIKVDDSDIFSGASDEGDRTFSLTVDDAAADADGDGIPNQLEYALGTDPNSASSASLPAGQLENGSFVFRFTRPTSVTDLTYTVQQSTDLVTWTTLGTTVESTTANTETLIATLTPDQPKAFVRLTVGSVATIPVGYINFTLTGSASTAFGLPLEDPVGPVAGLKAAKVAALTATTLTADNAGWSPGVLSAVSAPWVVRFTSGAAAGKVVDIAGNTASSLTLRNADLVTLGVTVGDTFELVPVDTLGTLFGATVLQGGPSVATADNVQMRSGRTALTYFYDTGRGYWRRSTATTNANATTVRPGAGLLLVRRGATETFTLVGRVLGTTYRQPVNNAGATMITPGFPTDTSLGDLAVQNRIAGWRSGTTTAADQVYLYNGSAWVGYVYNGSHWVALNGGAVSDTVPLAAGGVLLIQRPGTTAGTTDFVQPSIL